MATAKPMGEQPKHYARAKQTAVHFSISTSSLWSWAKHRIGFPKPMRAGLRTTLFDINAIEAFLQSDVGGEK